ncbi:MAG: hypothetical protein HYT63_03265 [Candidatus Yanofskybacteria bacterium]|nr:hypothetical protein [Candidatus Yanofskybacteria bacterium]
MASEGVRKVVEQIKNTTDELERLRLAIEFFNKPQNYEEHAIGWAESYLPVRDDGRLVAEAALKL